MANASPAVFGEHRGEGLHHAQYAEDIGVELRAGGFIGLRIEQTASPCNPRIVDDEGDVSTDSRGVGHVLIRGHVEFYRNDAGGGDGGWAASASVDLACTAGQRRFGEGESHAAIGTSDEHGGMFKFHIRALSCRRKWFSRSVAGSFV